MEKKDYTFQEIRQLFAEVAVMQKENAERFKRTDEKFLKTDIKVQQGFQRAAQLDKKFDRMVKEIGGIGNSNGNVAEEFFINNFAATLQVGSVKYDFIEPNKKREIGNLKGEYDIVLINKDKIAVIEVKYKLKKKHVREFYNETLPKFKKIFFEYKDFIIHGAMASFAFEDGAKKLVASKGMHLFTQSDKNIKRITSDDLVLSQF